MPYYITDEAADCSGWAVVNDVSDVYGCHETKESAIDQAVAISLSEDEEFLGERSSNDSTNKPNNSDNPNLRAINQEAPAYMRAAAR